MPLDVRVRRLLLAVLVLFVLAVALQIHGSSVSYWKHVLRDDHSPSGLLFSTPKEVRTDDWMAWTPAVLSQAFHDPPFPVENANLGAGKTPLLVNLPVRHYSMFFRPQLYGFFLFDIETAYAFYWSVKTFGLFVAFFLLFHTLTGRHFWLSLFGTLWVCFSAYIQWWFSCPPMLPEMLACWATAIVCVLRLFRTQTWLWRAATVLVLVVVGVNFVLCFYPPFQIPLVYLGILIVAGWFWQHAKTGLEWRSGVLAAGVALAAMAAVLTPYIIECKPTLEIVAATKYPGERRLSGGELQIRDTFNGVLGFFNASEHNRLATRVNSCEASNFYPLWLLVLAGSGLALWRQRRQRRMESLLLGFIAAVTLYTLVPFPLWLCRLTLFSYVTGTRAILPIGIAGILFTTVMLAKPLERLVLSRRVLAAAGAFACLVLLLAINLPGNGAFLTPGRSAALLALNAAFVALYFFAPLKVFCSVFVGCLVMNNGSVNPIATGLGAILETTPAAMVRQIREQDPEGKWAVYSNPRDAQFVKAVGADVINGLHFVPHLPFCRQLDPTAQQESIYNRYAFSAFILVKGDRAFEQQGPFIYTIDVSPHDPLMRAREVRYLLLDERLTNPAGAGLELIASDGPSNMWVYRVIQRA